MKYKANLCVSLLTVVISGSVTSVRNINGSAFSLDGIYSRLTIDNEQSESSTGPSMTRREFDQNADFYKIKAQFARQYENKSVLITPHVITSKYSTKDKAVSYIELGGGLSAFKAYDHSKVTATAKYPRKQHEDVTLALNSKTDNYSYDFVLGYEQRGVFNRSNLSLKPLALYKKTNSESAFSAVKEAYISIGTTYRF